MTSTEVLQKEEKKVESQSEGTWPKTIRATQRSMHAFLQSKVQKKSGSTAFQARKEEEEVEGMGGRLKENVERREGGTWKESYQDVSIAKDE